MLPALKQFDLVLGVDMHVVVRPPPLPPTPTPTPFTGFFFDPMAAMNAKVRVQGLPAVSTGSSAIAMPPHLPIAGAFLKPPSNDGELFMGSSTVLSEGEPAGYAALPVLTCQDLGVPAMSRAGKALRRSLYLPTSLALPIPSATTVLIGGTPTISMSGLMGSLLKQTKRMRALLEKVLDAQLERQLKGASMYLNALADGAFGKLGLSKQGLLRNEVRRAICTATGHPVDVATGKVFTDFVDLTLPGPLPFAIERVWYSSSDYDGPLGHGWHASFDMALAVDDVLGVRLGDGRVVLFPKLQVGESHFDRAERMTLARREDGYRLIDGELRFDFLGTGALLPLVRIEDRNGARVCFLHEAGRLQTIVDAGGRRWTLRYRERRVCALEGPHPTLKDGRVVYARWAYDEAGNLVEASDALGHAQQFAYRDRLLVRETLKSGLSFHFTYDEQARCVRTWGDGGLYDHKLHYDPLFQRTTVEDSLGHRTVYEHDGAMVHRTTDALGNQTHVEYGEGYRVLASIDELGQRTTHAYDARGNLVATTLPDGATTRTAFENDLPVRAIDPIGGEWTWSYDAHGRELARRDPLGHEVRREYGEHGLRSVDRTELTYDAQGNLVAIVEANGARTAFEHDLLGRIVALSDARGARETRTLDLCGRATEIREPDGNVRALAYDAEGNLLHAKDTNSEVHFAYCGMNRLAVRKEAGSEVRFCYDTEEQLTAVINEHGLRYGFERGPTGHVEVERGFDGLTRRYSRNGAGRVTRVDRPGERWSAYTYDELGRVVAVEHFDGSRESYAYRADGALLSASNDDTSVDIERDALGRIAGETQSWSFREGARAVQGSGWVASEYDATGARVRMHSSRGVDQHITRDLMGDAVAVDELHSGFRATFARDLLGAEVERRVGDVRSRWTYDRSGRPHQHIIESGGRTLRAVGYQWSPNDRLRALIDSERGPTRFSHDTRGYLARADYPDGKADIRNPDAVGNLYRTETRTDRSYGPAGELLRMRDEHGETHFTYDPEGNLLTKREPGGATWHYAWNAAGLLRAVTRPDGDKVTFHYDPFARRVGKTYRGRTTHWLWDGDVPLHEWIAGDSRQRAQAEGASASTDDRPTREPGTAIDESLGSLRGLQEQPITWLFEAESFAPLASIQEGAARSFHCDHLGTPLELLDESGQRKWAATLDAYGKVRGLHDARHACPLRWPGQHEDAETGLYYNRYRYYDPASGQYSSRDPLGPADGFYGYVADVNRGIDPFGLVEEWVNPSRIHFSQAYVRGDTVIYEKAMRDGTWDWNRTSRGGQKVAVLTVADVDGQLVSFDNRRLLAAQNAGLGAVPVNRVSLGDTKPGTAITWGESLRRRLNSSPEHSGLKKIQLPQGGSPNKPIIWTGCK